MLHYPCDQTVKHSSWRDSCLGPCGSPEPPRKEGRAKFTAGNRNQEFRWLPEKGVWQGVITWEETKCSAMNTNQGKGHSNTARLPPPAPNIFLYPFSQQSLTYWLQAVCHALFSCGNVAYVLVKEDRQKCINAGRPRRCCRFGSRPPQ